MTNANFNESNFFGWFMQATKLFYGIFNTTIPTWGFTPGSGWGDSNLRWENLKKTILSNSDIGAGIPIVTMMRDLNNLDEQYFDSFSKHFSNYSQSQDSSVLPHLNNDLQNIMTSINPIATSLSTFLQNWKQFVAFINTDVSAWNNEFSVNNDPMSQLKTAIDSSAFQITDPNISNTQKLYLGNLGLNMQAAKGDFTYYVGILDTDGTGPAKMAADANLKNIVSENCASGDVDGDHDYAYLFLLHFYQNGNNNPWCWLSQCIKGVDDPLNLISATIEALYTISNKLNAQFQNGQSPSIADLSELNNFLTGTTDPASYSGLSFSNMINAANYFVKGYGNLIISQDTPPVINRY